jgi:hypothetical protein
VVGSSFTLMVGRLTGKMRTLKGLVAGGGTVGGSGRGSVSHRLTPIGQAAQALAVQEYAFN